MLILYCVFIVLVFRQGPNIVRSFSIIRNSKFKFLNKKNLYPTFLPNKGFAKNQLPHIISFKVHRTFDFSFFLSN